MHAPSSKYLSHQPTILKGLSLNELCFVIAAGLFLGALAGVVAGCVFGFLVPFLIGGVLLGGLAGYFVLSNLLVKAKSDAPTHLLKKRTVIFISKYGLAKNPYTHYEGVWLKSRKVKG